MEKKTIWIALGSGLVAGLVAAVIVCTVCCNMPCKNKGMPEFPVRMEMMQHKMHHKGAPMGFHHKRGFHKFKEPTPEMKERFAKKLGLSDEQKATLEQYGKEDMAKMKPLFDEMDRIKGEIKTLSKANRARFESVLTDEQKEILQQMRAKYHKHGFRRHHHFMDEEKTDAGAKSSNNEADAKAIEAEKTAEALAAVEALAQ